VSDAEHIIARPLRALRLDSIRHEILVFAILAGVVPALATVVLYTRIKDSLTGQVGQELRVASSETAREMDEWLDERLYDLRASGTSYMLSENLVRVQISGAGPALTRLREYLSSLRRRFTDDDGLLISDSRGHGVTGSGRVTGMQLTPDDLNGLRTGESVVGDAWWDAALAKAVIVLAVPINDAEGRFVGALSAKVNLRSVTDLLQRLTPAKGGDLYLMTEQGRLVIKARASSAELMRNQIPADVLQALSEKEGMTVLYQRADGQDIVGTLRRVPQLRWAAVAELPRAEAFRTVAQLRQLTVFTLAALFAGVALITYMLGMLIVRPLARLTGAAAKVAAGDLTAEVPVGGSGEVGHLSQAFATLVARLRERESQADLERLSVTDALTGLYNRRHLMGTLSSEVQRTRRLRRTFSVLLVDVDRFKQYNDTYGHLAGDTALVKIADILRKATRGVDCVARYGGEEFLVMLLEATIATAAVVAERIRSRVAAEAFDGGTVTVSIGMAECPTHGDTPEDLIASADAAMYQAKADGRNRVVSANDLSQEEGVPAARKPRKSQA
jgi:diguanylate cyclase (GGDEF)-like protein